LSTITLAKVIPCGSLQARKFSNETVMLDWRYSIRAALSEAQNHAKQHLINKSSGGFQKITIDKKKTQIEAALGKTRTTICFNFISVVVRA
jgi:hypothetical protein